LSFKETKAKSGWLKCELMEVVSKKEKLDKQESELLEKVKILAGRTSPLARTLMEENKEEIEKIRREIEMLYNQQKALEEKLEENEKTLKEEYIQEQTERMVSQLLIYIDNHLNDIAYGLTRTFCIKPITESVFGNSGMPTGDIGVYDGSNNFLITVTASFSFDEPLYTVKKSKYDLSCTYVYNSWFDAYLTEFAENFCKEVKESFDDDENFKLTIKESEFTLELV